MKGNQTRQEIVRIGAEIIGQGGFNSTGIDAILKRAKVPKGSFYHYFESKDDFGLAVIDQHARQFEEQLESFLKDTEYAPLVRIRRYLESAVERIENSQCKRGCLIGDLGQELSGQSERFRKRIDDVFHSWKDRFTECLEMARERGELGTETDTRLLADFLLTGWEGAILRSKVMRSVKPMREFIAIFFGRVVG